jgi:hypothetical protein
VLLIISATTVIPLLDELALLNSSDESKKVFCTIAKEKAAKHMPVKIRRNWPISTGLVVSSKAFMNLRDKSNELDVSINVI